MTYFTSLLVANRGEIAVRVIRACRSLGIEAIAIYSDADARALHVREADRAIRVGPAPAKDSYLNIAAIIAAAQQTGAQAIHPGYGFLSENTAFARACTEAGIAFVGPSPEAIEAMGSKSAAKKLAESVGVPIIAGYIGDDQSLDVLMREAERIGFPLLIKASAGGGGKGMRSVYNAADFADALAGAKREAMAAFADDHVLLEQLLIKPRHIEIQVIADHFGNIVHLGERECSIQRRHQKVVEESPSIALSPELRADMGAAAVRLAQAVNYRNAGTLEFMLDQQGKFYFLEMNTRLQVEHPVTEEVTGIDLVQTQIAIAANQPLPWKQDDITQHGHAIEVRLYAEDPVAMLPSIGTITTYNPPEGPGVRLDTGVAVGDQVTINYDPMLAKLIVWGENRAQAVAKLDYALNTFAIRGVTTNLNLLEAIVEHPAFAAGDTTTDFLITHKISDVLTASHQPPTGAIAARALFDLVQAPNLPLPHDPWLVPWRMARTAHQLPFVTADGTIMVFAMPHDPGAWNVTIGDETLELVVLRRNENRMALRVADRIIQTMQTDNGIVYNDQFYAIKPAPDPTVDTTSKHAGGDASLESPMPGTIIKVMVNEGDPVSEGQPLLIMEAMKMEHTITAPYDGTIKHLPYKQGAQVTGGVLLVEIEEQ